jgi:hypothetical protein
LRLRKVRMTFDIKHLISDDTAYFNATCFDSL